MQIKFAARHMIANGHRTGVTYATGPWTAGVDPTTIKVRPRGASFFPMAIRAALTVENNSDGATDYFEADVLRIVSSHPLYSQVKAAAEVQS